MSSENDLAFYQNPILKGYADPDVYFEDGIFYLYATSYHVEKGYEVLTSANLVDWEKKGMALEEAWGFPGQYWAPDVKKIGNRYVMAASVSDNPLGEYQRCPGNPILAGNESVSGCGHHCIIQTAGKELYLLYHTHAACGGKVHPRQLALDRMSWEGDRLVVFGPTVAPQPMPVC